MVLQAVGQVVCPSGLVRSIAIARHTGLENRQISDACAKLESNGLLTHKKYADGTIKPGCYLLTAAGRAALEAGVTIKSGPKGAHGKPRRTDGSLREKVWRLLRIRRKVSVPEAVALLCDGEATAQDIENVTNNVQKYLRALRLTGYLADMRREAGQAPSSNGFKRYLLVRDTGPQAPTRRAHNRVYDHNEGREYAELA
ncbi:hypothetical protein ACOTJH_29165 [Achromobacter xylosoxidans]